MVGKKRDFAGRHVKIGRPVGRADLMHSDRGGVWAELDGISKLKENWDARGGNSVSEKCIGNVRKLILGLNGHVASPDIYPNPNGTITMDWDIGGQLLSIEVGDTRFSSYWETDRETNYESGTFKGKIPGLLLNAFENMYPNSASAMEKLAVSTH